MSAVENNSDSKDQSGKSENKENQEQSTSECSEKETYFRILEKWVQEANFYHNHHKVMAYFPYYLMSNPQLLQQAPQQVPNNIQQNTNRNQPRRTAEIFDPARHEEIIRENGGYEYIIAPLYKRLIAEIIDIFILFMLKLLLAFVVIDLFDVNIGFELDFDTLRNYLEDDYKEILSFTSEFLILEIVTKIAACFYEAIWISQIAAATPGKMLMGIKVVHCEAVLPLEAQVNHGAIRALIHPATSLGFRRSLFRSTAKNILITLLFPMYFVLFFFRSNQMIYDLLTKTIVVEENMNPRSF
jgi:uncharacterized RDD family membrane protein YckC